MIFIKCDLQHVKSFRSNASWNGSFTDSVDLKFNVQVPIYETVTKDVNGTFLRLEARVSLNDQATAKKIQENLKKIKKLYKNGYLV